MFGSLVSALWSILPAYAPNSVAVLFGGGPPIDGGRDFCGNRLLGDGKTWRGAILGTLGGVVLAGVQNLLRGRLARSLPRFPVGAALGLSAGSMLGDVAGSFIKRRAGRERGSSFPLLDQLGFVVSALALTRVLEPDWFRETFTRRRVAMVVVSTPAIHLGTNTGAYLLGLKKEPW
jgi:CDP-2,3-bis-(O-geranylgeranyl)-sn-glycerol synthase